MKSGEVKEKNFSILIGRESIEIEKAVFLALLKIPAIEKYAGYKKANLLNKIKLSDLKLLATKASIPYPLFFAPKNKVDLQIKDKLNNFENKFPTKQEMKLNFRGRFVLEEVLLIVEDLGRKQEFLKNRVLVGIEDNIFVGSLAKKIKSGVDDFKIAQEIREYFGIDLNEIRKLSKEKTLEYICFKVEEKNIFFSFSSHNNMPQNLEKTLVMSGICVKDKKFPYIFINTRDGDKNPLILETYGRQIFTLLSMLVCIGMNKFVISTKGENTKNSTRYGKS